jgi:predicted transcriptional regulator
MSTAHGVRKRPEDRRKIELLSSVSDIATNLDSWPTRQEIIDYIEMGNTATIKRTLAQLVEDGLIVEEPDGRYRITEHGWIQLRGMPS